MDLILWRHAEAADAAPGEADLQRLLTAHGQQQAREMAAWLGPALPAGTRVLASPALRTQQTVSALGRAFDTLPAIGPGASVATLLAAVGWPQAGGAALAVTHQPTIGLAASWLLCGVQQPWAVGKGAVWWFRGLGRDDVKLVAMRQPEA